MHLQDRGGVGAGAEEGGLAEGILPAIAAEDVPALAGKRDQERDDQEVQDDIGVNKQRHHGERRHHDDDRQKRLHAPAPNSPRGRTKRTTMKIRKMPTWPSNSPK